MHEQDDKDRRSRGRGPEQNATDADLESEGGDGQVGAMAPRWIHDALAAAFHGCQGEADRIASEILDRLPVAWMVLAVIERLKTSNPADVAFDAVAAVMATLHGEDSSPRESMSHLYVGALKALRDAGAPLAASDGRWFSASERIAWLAQRQPAMVFIRNSGNS